MRENVDTLIVTPRTPLSVLEAFGVTGPRPTEGFVHYVLTPRDLLQT